MAVQESRLVISIDAKNAERTAKALNDELKKMQSSGETGANAINKIGGEAEKQTSKLTGLKTSIVSLANEIKSVLSPKVIAAGAVAATSALVALAIQTANTAAEIERLAYLSGTTTTEFQEWAVGARAMGIEMDKLSDIFKDTRDRVGDFISTGGGELGNFFKEIAVQTEGSAEGALKLAKAMRELSGADALQLYVSKLEEAGISQNEMVFYMEAVADEATSLIPLLENGGEGFRLWAEAARNAGAIMDEETLAAAQRLKVETQLLEMQFTGLKNQFMSAVIPALNQIASAFLSSSEQGVQFNSVAEGVANTMIWLAKVGTGVAATFDIIGKSIGGAIAAMTDKNVTHQMVLDDLSKTIDGWGTKLNKLNDSSSNNKLVESLTQVQLRANQANAATAKTAVNTKNMADALKESNTESDKAAKNAEKMRREAERHAREVQRIVKEYSTDDDKRRIELEEEIARLREYGLTQYIEIAKNRFNEEAKLIKMKFEHDLVEFELSEEKKLRFKTNIREQEIKADAKLTQEQQKLKLDSLKIEFGYELAQIELNKEKRLFAANEVFMSEKDKIAERYRLEREEILRNKQLTEQERQTQIAGTFGREALDTASQQQTVAQNYLGAIGVDYSMEAEFQKRREAIIAANEWEFITEQEKNERLLQLDREYQAARLNLQLSYGQQIAGSFADTFKTIAGEQSNGYKLMFTAQKAFAIASSLIAIKNGIAQAFSLPFPLNLGAAATVAAQTATLVSDIKAVREGGFKSGGYTGNGGTSEVAGVVHGQEYVLNAEATKRVGRGTLDALNNGGTLDSGSGVNVIINVPQGYKAVQTQSENGVTIDIVENMINQSWGNVNRPNSNESRAIQGAFGIAPKR